jgi:DNA-binding transcriptional regulator YdaS (Cro superfamily)
VRAGAHHCTQQIVIDTDNKLLDGRGMKLETYLDENGGAVTLAKELGVSPEAVRLWVRGDRLPKPVTAMRIERLTDGRVTRADLRPDIYPRDEITVPTPVAEQFEQAAE